MLYDLLKAIASDIEQNIGIPAIIEPTLVDLDEPHVAIEASPPGLRRVGITAREFDGKVYEVEAYDVSVPIRLILRCRGQEEALKQTLWDTAFRLSLHFYEARNVYAAETVNWTGATVITIIEKSNEYPVTLEEEGSYPYTFQSVYAGYAETRYYVVISETGKLATAEIRGEIMNE